LTTPPPASTLMTSRYRRRRVRFHDRQPVNLR
jgi:hypothetical protein